MNYCRTKTPYLPALAVTLIAGAGIANASDVFSVRKNNYKPVEQPGAIAGTCTYQLATEDGTAENSIGLQNGGSFAWANQFVTQAGCTQISAVQLSWGAIPNGTSAAVFVLSDPNQDGNPNDSNVLAMANVTVQNSDTDVFNTYPVTPVIVSGNFFIGVRITHAAGQFPANIDQTDPDGTVSWIALGFTDPNDPFDTAPDANVLTTQQLGNPALVGDWTLRAAATSGNDCLIPLPFCNGDVAPAGGDGQVNVSDLLAVISNWGLTGPPRPQGDCAPLPNGDCTVNVADLLAVINAWGTCPIATGACCTNGVCSTATQADCVAGGGTYQGDGTNCGSINCPPPTPANDECTGAEVITCGQTVTVSPAVMATYTINANDPTSQCELDSGGPFTKDFSWWYKITTGPTDNGLEITTCGSTPATDVVVSVWQGTCGGSMTLVACDDDACTAPDFGPSSIPCFPVQPNTEYYILVQHYQYAGNENGPFSLTVTCCPFTNDQCAGATPITIGQAVSDTLAGATADSAPNCQGVPGNGIGRWFKVVGNGTTLTASCNNVGVTFDLALNVYCADTGGCAGGSGGNPCGGLICVTAENNDECGGLAETVQWCSAPGQTYWILVQRLAGAAGNFQLIVNSGAACANPVSCSTGPVNNHASNPLPIALGNTNFSTVGATTDGVVNAGGQCSDSGGTQTVNDIWYTFTAPQNGTLQVTTCSNLGGATNYDSDIVIYDRNLPGGMDCPPADSARIGCNDDDTAHACGSAPPWASTAVANVVAGGNYVIRVGGWNEATDFGTGVLNLSIIQTVCGNGVLEPGEQCDPPGPGCDANCQLMPNCPAGGCQATDPEPCATDGYVDATNGGCNSTPAVFGSLIAGQTKCGNVSTYIATGGGNSRDTDWHLYTVGASGKVRVDFKSPIPTVSFLITSGSTCPAAGVQGLGWSDDNVCATYMVTGLTPGSQVVVFLSTGNPDGSAIFDGFPCNNPDGTQYEVTVTSPN